MKPGFLLGEVWNGLRRNAFMAISVILVTLVSVFLLGLGMLAQRQADVLKGYWFDRIQVSIYLCNEQPVEPNCQGQPTTEAQRASIESQLRAMPEVEDVFYESQEDAFKRFKEQFSNSAVSDLIKVGDIPASFRVQLKDPSKFAVITSQFEGAPGVGTVQDQEKVLGRVLEVIDWITYVALALALAMALCAAVLISTTIRQTAYVRRREIGIMRLVGAGSWSIRMPFMLEVLLMALIGAALGMGGLAVFVIGLTRMLTGTFSGVTWIGQGDVLAIAPLLVGGMVAVAVVTSIVTLRRYLRV